MLYTWQMITSFNSTQGKPFRLSHPSSSSEEKKDSLELILCLLDQASIFFFSFFRSYQGREAGPAVPPQNLIPEDGTPQRTVCTLEHSTAPGVWWALDFLYMTRSPLLRLVSLKGGRFTCVCSGASSLFETPWTAAHQAPLSLGSPRHGHWSGCHFLLQGIFLTQGSSPSPESPASRHVLCYCATWEVPVYFTEN